MNKTWLLLKIQLLNFFNINKALHSGAEDKRKLLLSALGVAILLPCLLLASFSYSFGLAAAVEAGGGSYALVPGFMMAAACFVILLTCIYKTGGSLFMSKDYDLVMSLPVSARAVAASRLLLVYSMNMSLTLVIMLPAGVVYALKASPPAAYYPFFLVALVFLPLIPIVIGSLLGAVIAAFSSRLKRLGNYATILLTFAFVLAVMYFTSSASSPAAITSVGEALTGTMNRFYPPARMYMDAVCGQNALSLLGFLLISSVFFAAFCLLVSLNYRRICTRLNSSYSGGNFRLGALKTSSPLGALFRRELRRYLSSSIYVVNTAIGPVLMLAGCIALAAFGADAVLADISADLPGFVHVASLALPFVVSAMVCMGCTTGSSVSLENGQFWIVMSSPAGSPAVFLSKVLVNFVITVPVALICATVLAVLFGMSGARLALMYLTPLVYAAFSAVFGLLMNLLFPKLDWTVEAQVVKQSAAAIISMLGGAVFAILPLIAVVQLPEALALWASAGATAVTALLTLAMCVFLRKSGSRILLGLGE